MGMIFAPTCPYCRNGAGGPLPLADREGQRIVFVRAMSKRPDDVPETIWRDYQDACLFYELSPRVSASLACRCLLEMIRDKLGLQKPRLSEALAEAQALPQARLRPQTQCAINHVLGFPNVRAHIDKDVNPIIDVEPKVAQKLVWLIEFLLPDWYSLKPDQIKPCSSI